MHNIPEFISVLHMLVVRLDLLPQLFQLSIVWLQILVTEQLLNMQNSLKTNIHVDIIFNTHPPELIGSNAPF